MNFNSIIASLFLVLTLISLSLKFWGFSQQITHEGKLGELRLKGKAKFYAASIFKIFSILLFLISIKIVQLMFINPNWYLERAFN